MRQRADQTLADRAAPLEPRHLLGEAGLVRKHHSIRVDPGLQLSPRLSTFFDVETVLFRGKSRLFLTDAVPPEDGVQATRADKNADRRLAHADRL